MRTAYAMPLHLDKEDQFFPGFTLPQLGTLVLGIGVAVLVWFVWPFATLPESVRAWGVTLGVFGGLFWKRRVWHTNTLGDTVRVGWRVLRTPGKGRYVPGALSSTQRKVVRLARIVGHSEAPLFYDTHKTPFALIECDCVPLHHWEEQDAIPFLSKLAGALNALGNDLKIITHTEEGRIRTHLAHQHDRLAKQTLSGPAAQMRVSQLAHLEQRATNRADRGVTIFLLVSGPNEEVVTNRRDRLLRLFGPFGARTVSRARAEVVYALANGAPDWSLRNFFDGRQHFFGTASAELVVTPQGARVRPLD